MASSGSGGGVYGGTTISNNTISRNTASSASAIYFGGSSLSNNTITDNTLTGLDPKYTIFVNSSSSFNFNNFVRNSATYELYNNNAQGSANLDATNNWWETSVDADVQAKIYDFFDDGAKGIVTYSPFSTAIRTDAPISPPTGLTATAGVGSINLSWSANTESDLAGYKVYWDTDSGHPYANSIDVGNVLSHTITGLSAGTYYVTVTAYDSTAATVTDDLNTIVNEKQTAGNESWYATEKTVGGVSKVQVIGMEPQTGGKDDEKSSAFGCGGIDIRGGTSGPPDMGGPVSLIFLLSLPFIMRLWRRRMRLLRLISSASQ